MISSNQYCYDIFLSHSESDRRGVESVAHRLRAVGLRPFFQPWHLVPGDPEIHEVEQALENSAVVAVFFGNGPPDSWRNEEVFLALSSFLRDQAKRVIPVLLPGGDATEITGFLRSKRWVDLADPQGFASLVAGAVGKAPELFVNLNAVPERVQKAKCRAASFGESRAEKTGDSAKLGTTSIVLPIGIAMPGIAASEFEDES